MALPGGAAMNITIRLQFEKDIVSFSDIAAAIGKAGGDIVGIDVISSSKSSHGARHHRQRPRHEAVRFDH